MKQGNRGLVPQPPGGRDSEPGTRSPPLGWLGLSIAAVLALALLGMAVWGILVTFH